ncbi:MAG TPA: DNA repair protein RadA [Microbacteriaceae bacterium]|nr:DNA repair protein RadA [Microbacteriaceae bacterium]
MSKTGGYECAECGWRALKWVGRCGECQSWGTVVEAGKKPRGIGKNTVAFKPVGDSIARPITEIASDSVRHFSTGISELDRVLGGGLVPGAAILFSGEPGVGKSTLLLSAAAEIASRGSRVLYSSGEESTGQVRMRAERTGALESNLYLAAETDLGALLGQIEETKPDLVVVDSIQTLSSDAIEGIAGGPAQVREAAATLIRIAKEQSLPIIMVGHVTKDGNVAGPRVLEHLVDVVCHFEGDRDTSLRFLRTLKNRFGPIDEVGCFEMLGNGIAEVPDPSALFLSGSATLASGVCSTVTLEGRRALPAEVQALVSQSSTPHPRRVTSGVDGARVAMILAVLEKHLGEVFSNQDVYVSTVRGAKLHEPAADLAIALAILSSAKDLALPKNSVAFGEISLAGEIRPVTQGEQRKSEAGRLGLNRVIDSSLSSISQLTKLFQRSF